MTAGPTTEILTCQLKLTNPGDRRICFKVKTTAPKRYCVRPNNGIVEGRSTATILVMLQPFDSDAAQNAERFKHKFMVQTCFAPEGDIDLDLIVRLLLLSQLIICSLMSVSLLSSPASLSPVVEEC